jgi:GH35 family endo-1,4-beta-xylanase
MDNETTAEEIARHYSAAMDSVNLINEVIADPPAYANDETVIQRNVDHLKIMVAKDYWTTEDLTPFNDAIASGEAV